MCFGHSSGGMELDAYKTAQLLSKDCHISLMVRQNTFLDDFLKDKEFSYKSVDFSSGLSLNLIFSLINMIQSHNIENVILFGVSEVKSLYVVNKFFPKLNIIVRHGTTKKHSKKDLLHKIFHSCVNTHIAIGEHLRKNVEHIFPIAPQSRLVKIYRGLQLPDSTELPQDKAKLIHIGRIAGGKGQLDTIKVLKKISQDFEISYLGDIQDQSIYQEMLSLINGDQRFKILGFQSKVQDFLKHHNILFFPSMGEGLPNSVIEALGLGLVVVAYNNTAFPELRELGLHIVLAEDQNLDDLENKLKEVIENLPAHLKSAQMNMEKVRSIFNFDQEKSQLLSLLQ
jgi:glycosyltransferase involved in cell wall biosynthesis